MTRWLDRAPRTAIKRIESIERGPTSPNGNPSYWLTFTDGETVRTSVDASCAYAVGNPGMRAGCDVAVEYSRAGRITHLGPMGTTS